jgi:hypothetical protein
MQFGVHLHELWKLRRGVLIVAILATLLALDSVAKISISPPGLHNRTLAIAGAQTHVLVDSPKSRSVDFNSETTSADISALTQRAVLVGNVMASLPVRQFIAQHSGIPANLIQAVAPVTANVPRAVTEPGSEKRTSDLWASTDQYRLDIEANPSVPILDIYSQAPTTAAAIRLANGAVAGLQEYLRNIAVSQHLSPAQRVTLLQLGAAAGGVVTGHLNYELFLLTFLVVFVIGCCTVVFISRARQGWKSAGGGDRLASALTSDPLVTDGNGASGNR